MKTARDKRFILYATDTDFANIRHEIDLKGVKACTVRSTNTTYLEEIIKITEDFNPECIVLIHEGNRIRHPYSEKALKHEIIFFSNEAFDFILSVLAKNPKNIKER